MNDPLDDESKSWREKKQRARELHREAHEMRREAHRMRREERREGRGRSQMHNNRREGGRVYRSRNGLIFGVCRGVADYLCFSVFWFRFLTVCVTLFTGFWPLVGAYILAALLMKPEPVVPFEEDSEQEFYDSYVNSRSMALSRLKRTFDNLERRIRRMENLVTAREYDWERRLNERG
jgi:phage shock protein C